MTRVEDAGYIVAGVALRRIDLDLRYCETGQKASIRK